MILETKHVQYQYPNGQKFDFPDIKVNTQEHFLITGKSGVGKTTLLHLLAGINQPLSGEIIINNQNIANLSPRALDKFRGQTIGLVLQQNHFISSLSVLDNLLITSFLSTKHQNKNKAIQLLDFMGLSACKQKKTYELSVGQQQRLSIARALMNNPLVILADEPTSSLDDDNTQKVVSLLQQISDEFSTALIVVTHDLRLKSIIKQGVNLSL